MITTYSLSITITYNYYQIVQFYRQRTRGRGAQECHLFEVGTRAYAFGEAAFFWREIAENEKPLLFNYKFSKLF